MKLSYKTLDRRTYDIDLGENNTIESLKENIYINNELNINKNTHHIKVIFNGKVLENGSLIEHGVKDGQSVVVFPTKKKIIPRVVPVISTVPVPVPSVVPIPGVIQNIQVPDTVLPNVQRDLNLEDIVPNEYIQTTRIILPEPDNIDIEVDENDEVEEEINLTENSLFNTGFSDFSLLNGLGNTSLSYTPILEPILEEPIETEEPFDLVELISNQLAQHPEILLQTMLQNPDIAAIYEQNPEQVESIINSSNFLQNMINIGTQVESANLGGVSVENGNDGVENEETGNSKLELSEEDLKNVDELISLGFNSNLVLQYYLACDKNKEVTANMLFAE